MTSPSTGSGGKSLHPADLPVMVFVMRWQTLYEGRWIFVVVTALGAISFFLLPWLGWIFVLLLVFCLQFFRDPERPIPADPDLLVAPADGVVADVIPDGDFPGRELPVRIGIFLSVFDVHVNRTPAAGTVVSTEEKNGKYLDARHPDASRLNAFRSWLFHDGEKEFAVRQITGAIARRIVPWSKPGEVLEKGERFGMIRFGSRTELFLPPGSKPLVSVGDRVKGGETVVARWPEKQEQPE